MEKILETSQAENKIPQLHQPPNPITSDHSPSPDACRLLIVPDHLKFPKAFNYPERYTSPTDLMMSPVSIGLLARRRKANALLKPSKNHPKLQSL